MGNIHMTDDGVHVDGEVEVVKTLYTSKIKSLQVHLFILLKY